MLLKALYDFAQERKLLDSVHLQERTMHLLIPINSDGELIGKALIPLSSTNEKGKDVPGAPFLMPRFPGENNGGKSYFLAESCVAMFGIEKDGGDGVDVSDRKLSNPAKAFQHFWERIKTAFDETSLPVLESLLKFQQRYLYVENDRRAHRLPFIEKRLSKSGESEVGGLTVSGGWVRLDKATLSFQVDGNVVFDGNPLSPLTEYWRTAYRKEAFADDDEPTNTRSTKGSGHCLITGETGHPIARSHKPKILGVPNVGSGGYVVSFASGCPAFSSYGFKMGENAPVSEDAAASYTLGLQTLIDNENHSLKIGPTLVCFWAKQSTKATSFLVNLLTKPDPKSVADFLKNPWAGVDRHAAALDQFYSVTLSGNAGRIVVRHWMQTTVETARENFKKWFEDLDIVSFGDPESTEKARKKKKTEDGGPAKETSPPLSLFRLACTTVREAKDLQADIPAQLYRAALENDAPSVLLIKPILHRLEVDLIKFGPKTLLNSNRFSLLKLILNRQARKAKSEGKEFAMEIAPGVCQTHDAAYNCGRLLAVFDDLQMAAHEYQLEGAGVVERYYGTASSSPNSAFGILWRLHQHHLRKVSKQGNKGRAAEAAIKRKIGDIASLFPQRVPMQPPEFPRTFTLVEQGRFALGFYQQKASDDAARREHRNNKKAEDASPLEVVSSDALK